MSDADRVNAIKAGILADAVAMLDCSGLFGKRRPLPRSMRPKPLHRRSASQRKHARLRKATMLPMLRFKRWVPFGGAA